MKKLFAIYDSKAEAWNDPMTFRTTAEAIRSFEQVCNDKTTQFFLYPADYTLFELGGYDDETGTICPHSAKISLGLSQDFKKQGLRSAPEMDDLMPNKGL